MLDDLAIVFAFTSGDSPSVHLPLKVATSASFFVRDRPGRYQFGQCCPDVLRRLRQLRLLRAFTFQLDRLAFDRLAASIVGYSASADVDLWMQSAECCTALADHACTVIAKVSPLPFVAVLLTVPAVLGSVLLTPVNCISLQSLALRNKNVQGDVLCGNTVDHFAYQVFVPSVNSIQR